MNIAVYASAHGYGHAARSHEIARTWVACDASVTIYFTSNVADSFFASEDHPRIHRRRQRLDVGMKQIDSLRMDIPGTLEELDRLEAQSHRLVGEETDFLREKEIALVLSDLPHLAFEAASEADIPSWGFSNFSWDWIYEEYVGQLTGLAKHIERIRGTYRRARGLLRLPFHNDMDAFHRIIDVPLAARVSELGKCAARRRLGWEGGQRVILLSFGGMGQQIFAASPRTDDLVTVTCDPSPHPGPPFEHITNAELERLGLRYCDLVAAADVVVSKLGYGIVSECIANRTALVYTPRGQFREYPLLAQGVAENIPSEEIRWEDFGTGRWLEVCRETAGRRFPRALNGCGSKRVVERLSDLIRE